MSPSPRRPSPYQISAFAHTVREGGVSAAARKLGVTQSAVSQHLQKLERSVGNKLVIQTGDGLTLTKTGQELYDLADRYLNAEKVILEKFGDYAQLQRGNLSIIANAPQPTLRLISRYSQLYPDVAIEFAQYDWTSAMRLLRSRTIDIGIVAIPTEAPEFVSYELERLRYVLYVRTDHPLAGQKQVSLKELMNERFILPETGSLTQRVVRKALDLHGIEIHRITKMTTFPLIKDAILQGVGVGPFLEKSATSDEGLVSLPIKEMPEEYPICLVAHRDKIGLHLIDSFLRLAEAVYHNGLQTTKGGA